MEIYADQQRLFQILCKCKEPLDFQSLVYQANIAQAMAMATMTGCVEQGLATMEESAREELVPADGVEKILEKGVPERQFLMVLKDRQTMPMREVAEIAKNLGILVNEVIKWGGLRGWFEKEKGDIRITEAGKKAAQEDDADERALKLLTNPETRAKLENQVTRGERFTRSYFLDELKTMGYDTERIVKLVKNRPELAKIKERTARRVMLTPKGYEAVPTFTVKEEKSQLTSQDIVSGNWEKVTLRSYDVTLSSKTVYPKKCHPLQKIIQEARMAFLQMGFEEMASPQVETSFWDFDALFQPQDHPSRDMQDTFYLKDPEMGKLPDASLVEKVKKTHQNGGNTGSTGWGYQWSEREASKMVLRTHTTATSVRTIFANPNPPRKLFCVGRVFRNETMDYKHLAEFHQVDGIIIDEHASFACLLGTLREFYKKMGFDKVKFKPDFFPYTEPSAGVFVWMEAKGCWLEFGGCGVFRPEVTLPLGCKVPVLAWGLGLERLAMLRYGLTDIRTLYRSDLGWLQEVKLCQ